MKIRKGFVSNSSSSSFVVAKYLLTGYQIDKLLGYNTSAGEFLGVDEDNVPLYSCGDGWSISSDDHTISGFTIMDNGDMWSFMKNIGIDMDVVKFDYN